MCNKSHKFIRYTAMAAILTGGIHILNRSISVHSQLKNMLKASSGHYFKWRFGKIYYTKRGIGKPMLLVHDIVPGASGYEWSAIEKQLAKDHTVYTVDLLGCGRSDKPALTYTNFMFVQLLCDFAKEIIKQPTDILASGFSSSFAIMANKYKPDCFDRKILINPPSIVTLKQSPSYLEKLCKGLIDLPIFGTLVYHVNVSRETLSDLFINQLYYNPFHVRKDVVNTYYEAAHKGGYNTKYIYSSFKAKYMNLDISKALSDSNKDIFILEGEHENNAKKIVENYCKLNVSIKTAYIEKSKHLPHQENAAAFLKAMDDIL